MTARKTVLVDISIVSDSYSKNGCSFYRVGRPESTHELFAGNHGTAVEPPGEGFPERGVLCVVHAAETETPVAFVASTGHRHWSSCWMTGRRDGKEQLMIVG